MKLNYVTRGSGSLLWIAGLLAKGIKKNWKEAQDGKIFGAAGEVSGKPLQLLGGEGGP